MQTLDNDQIADLLAIADGDVSYQSQYSRTTAEIDATYPARWKSKRFARDVMDEIREAECKAAYVPPVRPTVADGPRSRDYTGPFPRKRHSHHCRGCEARGQINSVACYKSKCTAPQLTATCSWCASYYAGGAK